MGEARAAGLKSLADHQQSVKYMSTTVKTLWPARTATFTKDRWIQAYSICWTIMGELGSPNDNKNKCLFIFCVSVGKVSVGKMFFDQNTSSHARCTSYWDDEIHIFNVVCSTTSRFPEYDNLRKMAPLARLAPSHSVWWHSLMTKCQLV